MCLAVFAACLIAFASVFADLALFNDYCRVWFGVLCGGVVCCLFVALVWWFCFCLLFGCCGLILWLVYVVLLCLLYCCMNLLLLIGTLVALAVFGLLVVLPVCGFCVIRVCLVCGLVVLLFWFGLVAVNRCWFLLVVATWRSLLGTDIALFGFVGCFGCGCYTFT